MEFCWVFPYDGGVTRFGRFLATAPLAWALAVAPALAESPYIAVGAAKTRKTVIAFPSIQYLGKDGDRNGLVKAITETVTNDLTFMDLFRFLPSSAFLEDPKTAGLTPDKFRFSDWQSIGTEFLLKAAISPDQKTFALETYFYDINKRSQLISKRYVAELGDVRTVGHTLANDIVNALTGLPGIFLTKIAMSCDRTGKKEIHVMDFDGTNVKQITHHRSIAFAPAWSPDGTKIAYSLYTRHRTNVKNIDLYVFDFTTNTIRLLSSRKGINSGASYSPDGRKIALTMSFLGNPEIFILDPSSREATRVTSSFGFDVDPIWSPDGKQLAFVSSRTGQPMVFKMDADGSNVERLTMAGRYNATPTWSPRGDKLAFAGWIDAIFDIFLMNADGTRIERLTKSQGNNEDPFFSPDGNFIVFSSNRTGTKNIYVMNIDGSFVKRLTYGLGNCVAPKWSNPPR